MQTFTNKYLYPLLGKTSLEKGNKNGGLRFKTRRKDEKSALGFLFDVNSATVIWSKERQGDMGHVGFRENMSRDYLKPGLPG